MAIRAAEIRGMLLVGTLFTDEARERDERRDELAQNALAAVWKEFGLDSTYGSTPNWSDLAPIAVRLDPAYEFSPGTVAAFEELKLHCEELFATGLLAVMPKSITDRPGFIEALLKFQYGDIDESDAGFDRMLKIAGEMVSEKKLKEG